MEYLDDPETYHRFLKECIERFRNYVSQNPTSLKKHLAKKFTAGGIEHGSPLKYTQSHIIKETEKEYLDALGWPLVGLFLAAKKKQKLHE